MLAVLFFLNSPNDSLCSFSSEGAVVPSGSGERTSPSLQSDHLGNHQSQPNSSIDLDGDQKPSSTPSRSQRQSRANSSSHSTTHSSLDPDSAERPTPVECIVCSELADQNVRFEPCMHRVACEDCSSRMKKCLQCGQNITRRLTQGPFKF